MPVFFSMAWSPAAVVRPPIRVLPTSGDYAARQFPTNPATRPSAPGQRRLGSGPCRPGAVHRHGREFAQDRVDEGADVGEGIPGCGNGRYGTGGGAHRLRIRRLLTGVAAIPLLPPDVTPIRLKVAAGPAPPGSCLLRTDSNRDKLRSQ